MGYSREELIERVTEKELETLLRSTSSIEEAISEYINSSDNERIAAFVAIAISIDSRQVKNAMFSRAGEIIIDYVIDYLNKLARETAEHNVNSFLEHCGNIHDILGYK